MKKRLFQRKILMKPGLVLMVLIAGYLPALSQVADKASQIEQVQTAAATLIGKDQKTELLLSDLSELEGSVVALTRDSFSLKFKGVQGKKITGMIRYDEVLAIKSKNISISFIPPENLPQYGAWDEVLKFPYNTFLEVVLENGLTVTGRTSEIKQNELTLINEREEKLVLPREQISFLYKVRMPSRKTGDGATGGARKGGDIGRAIGTTPSGKVFSDGLGTLIGTGIGSLSGAAQKGKKLRVLIYSK